jgi:hypothetical protein
MHVFGSIERINFTEKKMRHFTRMLTSSQAGVRSKASSEEPSMLIKPKHLTERGLGVGMPAGKCSIAFLNIGTE